MNKMSLYEILEVSSQASPEAIRAAYERLTSKLDAGNAGKVAQMEEVENQRKLVKDAFLTLANPAKRKAYDRALSLRDSAAVLGDKATTPWSRGWALMLVIALALGAGWYYKSQRDAEIEKERLAVEAKRIEAEKAQKLLELEALRAEQEKANIGRAEEARRQAEFEVHVREAESNTRRLQSEEERQRRLAESEQSREEQERRRAAAEAQRRLDADRFRLQQIEREYALKRGAYIPAR